MPGKKGAQALAATDRDPRSWLKSRQTRAETAPAAIGRSSHGSDRLPRLDPKPSSSRASRSTRSKVECTDSCARTVVVQSKLCAVAYPANTTGYRNPRDPCNRTDKRYGGNFRQFQSETQRSYLPVSSRPLQFRQDGQPISAQRVEGSTLMSPKPPRPWELIQHKAGRTKGVHTHSPLGAAPYDPRFYRSISSLVYTKPPRLIEQPNPEIAAMQSRRAHRLVGLLD